jgi:hypothetical protein
MLLTGQPIAFNNLYNLPNWPAFVARFFVEIPFTLGVCIYIFDRDTREFTLNLLGRIRALIKPGQRQVVVP